MIKSKKYLGKIVEVTIDRPIGSKHPKYNYIYPINYGYLSHSLSADGEELDCYVLGIFEPLQTYTGKCIAIIQRLNDNVYIICLIKKIKLHILSFLFCIATSKYLH